MKNYEKPLLKEVKVEIEDVIASSLGYGSGDNENGGDWGTPGFNPFGKVGA